jgi:hypothetical protein
MRRLLAIPLLVLLVGAGGQQVVNTGHHRTAPPASGGITRVGSATSCGKLIVSGGVATCSLAQTTTSGNFLACSAAAQFGDFLSTAILNPGSVAMTNVFYQSGGRDPIAVWIKPNTGTYTSVAMAGGSGDPVSITCREYAGMSTTAAAVATAVYGDSGNVSVNSWTTASYGTYTATANNLVLAGSSAANGLGTWAATGAWTLQGSTNNNSSSCCSTDLMMEDQLAPAAGNYTGTGTNSNGTGGTYYDSWVVSFK